MKSLELQLKERLLIVKAKDEKIALAYIFNEYGAKMMMQCELICKGSELTEGIAKTFSMCLFDRFYIDYKHDSSKPSYAGEYTFSTALESFISAVKAAGYHSGDNPVLFDDEETNFDKRHKNRIDWERAESRTFNPEKTLIFKII